MKTANVYWKDPRVDHKISVRLNDLDAGNVHFEQVDRLPVEANNAHKEISAEVFAALPFHDAESLKKVCIDKKLSISQVVFRNELHWRSSEEITSRCLNLWKVMNQSIVNGIHSTQEMLPGEVFLSKSYANS
jgi:hypothetical protein